MHLKKTALTLTLLLTLFSSMEPQLSFFTFDQQETAKDKTIGNALARQSAPVKTNRESIERLGKRIEILPLGVEEISARPNSRPASAPHLYPSIKVPTRPSQMGKERKLPDTVEFKIENLPARIPPAVSVAPFSMTNNSPYAIQIMNRRNAMQDHTIYSILEDRRGYLWFGTRKGLTRYDGEVFVHFTPEHGLPNPEVFCMIEDRQGALWLGTFGGLSRFDGTTFTNYSLDSTDIEIFGIIEDRQSSIWIGTNNGLYRYEVGSGLFTRYGVRQGLSHDHVRSIAEDNENNLWIGVGDRGVNCFDGQEFTHFTRTKSLANELVRSIFVDSRGHIWLGTDSNGVTHFDGKRFSHYTTRQGLIDNYIHAITEDQEGKIWLTTRSGVSRFDGRSFTNYTSEQGMSHNRTWSVLEDRYGYLWFGTSDGINRLKPNGFNFYYAPQFLKTITVYGFLEDEFGAIWVGAGPLLSKFNGRSFTHYLLPNAERKSLDPKLTDSKGNLWFGIDHRLIQYDGNAFYEVPIQTKAKHNISFALEDHLGHLWFSTRGGGVIRLEIDRGTLIRLSTAEGLIHEDVTTIAEGQQGELWFGTTAGLSRFDGKSFRNYTTAEGLAGNHIRNALRDRHGRLWFGTDNNGVSLYDPAKDRFESFTTDEGLSHNKVSSIIEDNNGNIWISTIDGITLIDTRLVDSLAVPNRESGITPWGKCYNLGEEDGLRNPEFPFVSALADSRNRLWWGSRYGITCLDANANSTPSIPPENLQLISLDINLQHVDYHGLRDSVYRHSFVYGNILQQAFDSVSPFRNVPVDPVLPYHLNHLTFHFSAKDPYSPEKVAYQYYLEGEDHSWEALTTELKADYRNLSPGKYTFRARAIGAAKVWSEEMEYNFRILPPWYLSIWAYLLYLLAFVTILYLLFRYLLSRRLKQAAIAQELELNAYKTALYANITHEFRTPITIILGMVRQIKAEPKKWYKEGMEMIHRNGRQLLQLVNQMLDLSKLDHGKMQLNPQRGELISYLKYLVQSFSSHAASKHIQLHFLKEVDHLEMDYDPKQLSKVLSNLLSNAVKYTQKDGHIYITVRPAVDALKSVSALGGVEISIRDTGQGIPAEDLSHVFDRFYQVKNSQTNAAGGTGIGLSLVKELVDLMRGEIQVQSKVGEGTIFTICLPVFRTKDVPAHTMAKSDELGKLFIPLDPVHPLVSTVEKGLPPTTTATLLLIEDNRDVMRYLASCLESQYHLEYAFNGREGVEQALELMPDLIISDIMMPEMDGYEVTDTLKNDERTSHIPILLLTAKADRDSKIQGLQQGADAYLSKPFDPEELDVRIRKLIQLRQKLPARYASLDILAASADPSTQRQDAFIRKLRKTLEDHINDEAFGIMQLARAMQVSRTQLHNKLKALTGKSTSQVIRTIRLQKAKVLLLSSDMNVSEVAYAVGFKNTTYFSSCFSEEFGIPPSELKNQGKGLSDES